MSFTSADDSREQVRQATDIVDLVGSYLELRRQGRNYVARCPWHDDSRPSLQVNQERQSWKCWVCNIGGDVFSFVMQREGVNFREALQMLADKAGIQLKQQKQAAAEPGSPDDKATLYQALAWTEKQFHDCLLYAPEAEMARRYFDERGISEASIARFKLGYSPDDWNWLMNRARQTSFSPEVLEATGVLGVSSNTGRHYDRFKGRVIFPIHDLQNRPIAFGGRVLPGAPADAAKYVNSPETKLFTKSDNLYALNLARDVVSKSKQIIVVEGYTDVIICQQSGLTDVVAVLGTALNERHIKLLRRFVDTVYLVLDGDEAGQRRTNEILSLFVAEQMDLRIMTLPDEMDPAEFLLERSADDFRQLLGGAVDALEHKIRVAIHGIDLKHDTHQANRALEDILATVAKAPRPIDAASKLREKQVLVRLSREFVLPESALLDRVMELRSNQARSAAIKEQFRPEPAVIEAAPRLAQPLAPEEKELLQIFTAQPELVPQAFDFVGATHLKTADAQEIFEVYRRLYEAGESADFHRVLSELEAPHLKMLLVALDDEAHEISEQSLEPADVRLRLLIQFFQQQDNQRDMREKHAVLETKALAADEETDLLKHLFELEMVRRGITAPTDGTRPRT